MANLLAEKQNVFWHTYNVIVAAGVVFFIGGTILPYFANFIIPMNWPSYRILYLGPFFVSMLCGLAFILWQRTPVCRAAETLLPAQNAALPSGRENA